jgi:maltose alpha-D-glucosyltransferase/alpha-amylase
LNHDNPDVVNAVIRVMQHWLDLGVDGLRLDAIPYLCVREGTNNENLPETHAVVKRFRRAVDAKYKNRMLLAEANQWPEDVREYFGDGDECHMAYHFPLMPRMYMAIAQEDRYPIVEILRQTPDIPPTCQWAIFLRNHDELTLEMVTDKERDYMYQMYAADPRARVNVGIRRRLAPLMQNDPAKIQLMNSLLFSMPGSPTVYYGDELGMGDNIYLGDRNSVRTPMQWSPDRNGGFSRADPQSLYLPPIMDPIYGYASVNVEAQAREPSSLLNWTRRMLAVRKTCKAFGRGTFELLRPGNRTILAYMRRYEDDAVLCVANLKRSAQAVELDLKAFRGRVPVEMIGQSSFPPIGELPYMLTLPGYAFYWFKLTESAAPPSWHEERLPAEERPWLVLTSGLDTLTASADDPRAAAAAKLKAQLEHEIVPSYLVTQRWFAGKGQGTPSVAIGDIGRWQPKHETWLLMVATAQFPNDAPQEYLLPLGLQWGERAGGPAAHTLARVRQRAATGILFDAFADDDFVRALLAALRERASVRVGSGCLRFTPTNALDALLPKRLAQAPVHHTGESSNLTFIVGERLFLKAYRRLRMGAHPEWEMGRFLTERSPCSAVPPTAGAIVLERPSLEATTVALVVAAVRNQGDGWRYTLRYLERSLDDAVARASDGKIESGDHSSYLLLARALAARTAELHRALAVKTGDPSFDPEPFSRERLAEWTGAIHAELDATLRTLRARRGELPAEARDAAGRALDAAERLHAAIDAHASGPTTAVAIRLHGDYHLGQVLITGNDFVITDLEGEPGRSIDERRRKHTVLKDVAAMDRSFDYARVIAARQFAAKPNSGAAEVGPFLEDWRRAVQTAFHEAYREALADTSVMPRDSAETHRLLALAKIERLLYEIRYELANRPELVPVPLADLRASIDA